MKKQRKFMDILAGLFLVLMPTGCSKENVAENVEKVTPKPSFTTNGAETSGLCLLQYINEPVSFDNTSEDCVSYLWDFGDGSTSTQESPKHIFKEYGVYNVKLTGMSKDSVKVSVKKYYSIDSRTVKPEIISATLVSKSSYSFSIQLEERFVGWNSSVKYWGYKISNGEYSYMAAEGNLYKLTSKISFTGTPPGSITFTPYASTSSSTTGDIFGKSVTVYL